MDISFVEQGRRGGLGGYLLFLFSFCGGLSLLLVLHEHTLQPDASHTGFECLGWGPFGRAVPTRTKNRNTQMACYLWKDNIDLKNVFSCTGRSAVMEEGWGEVPVSHVVPPVWCVSSMYWCTGHMAVPERRDGRLQWETSRVYENVTSRNRLGGNWRSGEHVVRRVAKGSSRSPPASGGHARSRLRFLRASRFTRSWTPGIFIQIFQFSFFLMIDFYLSFL